MILSPLPVMDQYSSQIKIKWERPGQKVYQHKSGTSTRNYFTTCIWPKAILWAEYRTRWQERDFLLGTYALAINLSLGHADYWKSFSKHQYRDKFKNWKFKKNRPRQGTAVPATEHGANGALMLGVMTTPDGEVTTQQLLDRSVCIEFWYISCYN